MVLWEITVATAYFLGLKRTYKLALKLQRRVVTNRHPKLRQFLHRRTRAAFDIALCVHNKVQETDIKAGRNLGNWLLHWLDNAKRSLQLQPPSRSAPSDNLLKHMRGYGQTTIGERLAIRFVDRSFGHRLVASPWNIRPMSLPTISTVIQPVRPVGMNGGHHWYLRSFAHRQYDGLFRKDIAHLMQRFN